MQCHDDVIGTLLESQIVSLAETADVAPSKQCHVSTP